jgi:hypothetical protein
MQGQRSEWPAGFWKPEKINKKGTDATGLFPQFE